MSKPATKNDESNPTHIEPMLSLEDIARMVRCDKRTIQTWRAQGFLCQPDLVHGKTVRWAPSTVRAWMAEQSERAR